VQLPVPAPDLQQQLFVEEDALARIRALASAKEDPLKKASLPDIIPGFKANPLKIAVSSKVDEAFRAFKYIPYSSLTHSARLKASRGEEDFVINSQGGITLKGLDRRDEKSITLSDWLGASKAAEECTRIHHGKMRVAAFAAHSDCHGFRKPAGLRVGYTRVRVWVSILQPSPYPYP